MKIFKQGTNLVLKNQTIFTYLLPENRTKVYSIINLSKSEDTRLLSSLWMFKIQNRGQFGNPIDFFIKPWQDESIEITDLLHLFSPDFSNDNNYLKTQ